MKYQNGVFSIELAFVLLGMCAFLFFIFDLGFQVVQKSQLHRASYSLASVLKERKDPFEWAHNKGKGKMDISSNETKKNQKQIWRQKNLAKTAKIKLKTGAKITTNLDRT